MEKIKKNQQDRLVYKHHIDAITIGTGNTKTTPIGLFLLHGLKTQKTCIFI
jgi:hypothetical protein